MHVIDRLGNTVASTATVNNASVLSSADFGLNWATPKDENSTAFGGSGR